MSTIKTKLSDASVQDFISQVDGEAKREDSRKLLKLFRKQTDEEAKLWGSSIIGFGQYHYKSERSAQEGDWPLIGFSPRKQSLTIYIMNGFDDYESLLTNLGKYTLSKSCLYIKTLKDVDEEILGKLIKQSYTDMKAANT